MSLALFARKRKLPCALLRFLYTVARAYALAALKGRAPAPAIAELAGVSRRAVHKWVYTARKRGVMPPGTRGRVG